MSRIAIFLLAAALLPAAENSWTSVKDLKGRSELRIYTKGAREPVSATFDEANDDRVVVVVKNKQVAIAKDDIDRIDARPPATARKMNVEKTEKATDPDPRQERHGQPAVAGGTTSSNVSFGGSKGEFETIYQRPVVSPKN